MKDKSLLLKNTTTFYVFFTMFPHEIKHLCFLSTI